MATMIIPLLRILIVSLLFISFLSARTHALDISITDFGAKGDAKTDSSSAFLQAWAVACTSPTPVTIHVPRKRYFLTQVRFEGPCVNPSITFRMEGILVAPDYKAMDSSVKDWIQFYKVQGVTIVGGFLEGQGTSLWACKATGRFCPPGATSLRIFGSKDIILRNVTSINSKLYHIVIHSCQNILLEGVRIYAPDESPNTDGVHVEKSLNVRIFNTGIKTGDDCVSIGPGTKNLSIQRVACGPGHGISIGSLGQEAEEEGVENVVVKSMVFTGTQNGLRIKSWARPSTGYVKGIVFKQIVMKDVKNPIIIDQDYCPHNQGCPGQQSGIQISNITYTGIEGTSISKVAMRFDCSATSPCKGINVENINLTYQGDLAESFCQNAHGVARGFVVPQNCLKA